MSNYYTDVYLRKLNRFGNSLQERIVNKKEYNFHNSHVLHLPSLPEP